MNKFILSLALLTVINLPASASIEEAKAAMDNKEYEIAKKQLKIELKNQATKNKAYLYLSEIALEQKELDDGEDYIKKLIKNTPQDPQAHFIYAQIMGRQAQDASIFSASGYAKKSLKGFKKAVELAPKNTDFRQGLMTFYLDAPGFVGGGKDKALEQAKLMLPLDAKRGTQALITVYQALEDKQQLKLLFAQIKKDFADDPDLNFQRGIYLQQDKAYNDAFAVFTDVSNMTVKTEEDTYFKFSSLYQIGRTSVFSKTRANEGISALRQYIDHFPELNNLPKKEWAEFRLAILLDISGKTEEAKQIYRQIKTSSSDKKLIKEVKKRL